MITSVMITCESRNHIKNQTLEDLYKSDWNYHLDIVYDKDCIHPSLYDAINKQERQTIAALNALKIALNKNPKFIIFMEDDLIFNKNITHNINNWEPIKNEQLNFGSLYTPNGNRCSLEEGSFWYKADCLRLYGSQFYIMSFEAAEWAINHWEEVIGMQDIKLTRLSRGKPIYYYSPSLVQHRDTPSVWGGISHTSKDFDEYWKHP